MSREALEAAKFAKELAKLGLRANDGDPATDFFVATGAAETFNGGAGADTVSYAASTDRVFINLSDATPELRGFAQGDRLISIENIVGSKSGDNILGSSGTNIIHGNQGNDVIDGNGGSDILYGGQGSDTLQVSTTVSDFAIMHGGSDNDTLIANMRGGLAEITTGSGADRVNVRINTADNFHVEITDFSPVLSRTNQVPTAGQAAAGDTLQFSIKSALVSATNVPPAFSTGFSGNDLVIHFDTQGLNGDVVLKDFVDLVGVDLFNFRIDFDFFA